MAKPTEYPDFAVDDVVDPVSGQNNVVAPSSSKMSVGWERFETPPRQYMNWIHRVTGLWCRYCEEITDDHESRIDDLETVVSSASPDNLPSTLVMRDINGRFSAGAPVSSNDVATRGWILDRIFEAGVRCVFYQLAAPNGWTLYTLVNDRVLMAVNNTSVNGGLSIGGNWTLYGLTVGGHVLTEAEMPAHNHEAGAYVQTSASFKYGSAAAATGIGLGWAPGVPRVQALTQTKGSSSAHTHGISSSGTWRPAYSSVIICIKDAL